MTYTVKFRDDAFKEWLKLDKSIQQQFAKKLKKCSENPHIPSAKLRGLKDCYKIKLRASGFRLVYQVIDDMLIIAVVATFSFGSTFMISSASTMILDSNPGNKGLTMSYISLMRNLFMSVIVGVTSSLSYREINPILMYLIGTALIQAVLVRGQLRMRHD